MTTFERLEELIDKQGYSVRAAIYQINSESDIKQITFDGVAVRSYYDDALIESSSVMECPTS